MDLKAPMRANCSGFTIAISCKRSILAVWPAKCSREGGGDCLMKVLREKVDLSNDE